MRAAALSHRLQSARNWDPTPIGYGDLTPPG